jgi:hypothetical protein
MHFFRLPVADFIVVDELCRCGSGGILYGLIGGFGIGCAVPLRRFPLRRSLILSLRQPPARIAFWKRGAQETGRRPLLEGREEDLPRHHRGELPPDS